MADLLGTEERPRYGPVLMRSKTTADVFWQQAEIVRWYSPAWVKKWSIVTTSGMNIVEMQWGTMKRGPNGPVPPLEDGVNRKGRIVLRFEMEGIPTQDVTFWLAPPSAARIQEVQANLPGYDAVPVDEVLSTLQGLGIDISSIGEYGAGYEPEPEEPPYVVDLVKPIFEASSLIAPGLLPGESKEQFASRISRFASDLRCEMVKYEECLLTNKPASSAPPEETVISEPAKPPEPSEEPPGDPDAGPGGIVGMPGLPNGG